MRECQQSLTFKGDTTGTGAQGGDGSQLQKGNSTTVTKRAGNLEGDGCSHLGHRREGPRMVVKLDVHIGNPRRLLTVMGHR